MNGLSPLNYLLANEAFAPKESGGGGGVIPNIQATAETLPAGSAATVTRTGSNANPVFHFGIPQGIQGEQGIQGDPGPGLPPGGAVGQIPVKASAADYDVQWADAPQGGAGDTYLVNAPVGSIVIWSGTEDNIPAGWQLCNGTNGTPDLRDKFVLSAGPNHPIGETGGSEEVTLTVAQMPSHRHDLKYGGSGSTTNTPLRSVTTGGNTLATNSTGGSQPHPNMPPYYAMCYIMKLTKDSGTEVKVMTKAEYTALTEEEKLADVLYGITDDGGSGGGGGPENVYSTEETRIGTWIDGKPLYQCTWTGTFPTGTNGNIPFLTIPNECEVHDFFGIYLENGRRFTFPHNLLCFANDGTVYVWSDKGWIDGLPAELTYKYTKTTDTGGT